VTLAQLKVFVLVARLGSVRAAATALGVSEPAVSQALASLRQHLDDPLLVRANNTMELTPAGRRVVGIASQMVNLAVEAEDAVRQSRGAPSLLRVVTTSTLADAVAPALLQAFTARHGDVEVTLGVASTTEMAALVLERLADVALGPRLSGSGNDQIVSEPLMRYHLVFVANRHHRLNHGAPVKLRALADEHWALEPAGTDPETEVARLIGRLGVPAERIRVFPNQRAALASAATGADIVPAVAHLAAKDIDTGNLVRLPIVEGPLELLWHVNTLQADRRAPIAGKLRRFLSTPEAMQAMYRADGGIPASRFKPPVYVTIWS
jgi:LysR family transcriptional regulator, low CO2-responsive transcriptional regulator